MLENWLIADPQGIRHYKFIQKTIMTQVGTKADEKDALAIIRGAFPKERSYCKAIDAPRLAACIRTTLPEVRHRSHSLDKFLRECGVSLLK